jgi:sulfate transport system permease protein
MNLSLRRHSVLPGFGLSLGVTVLYLSLIVLIPLSALVFKTFTLSLCKHFSIPSLIDSCLLSSFCLLDFFCS